MSSSKGRRKGSGGHPARQAGNQVTPAHRAVRARGSTVDGDDLVVFQGENYSGPVPHQSTISGYQEAIPNGGERLMTLVEGEAAHRHKMDRMSYRGDAAAHFFGVTLSFSLAVFVIYIGYKLVEDGYELGGYSTLLVGAGGMISSVIRQFRRRNDDA